MFKYDKDTKDLYNKISVDNSINIDSNHHQKYIINMKNSYLNKSGKIIKWQKLSTEYERVISEEIYNFCALTNINIKKSLFESNKVKKMNWHFGEGHTIPYFLYSANTPSKKKAISNKEVWMKIKDQVEKFTKSFCGFPKLPSLYLYIMQLYDMIAFENFASYFTSVNLSNDNIGKYIEVKTLTSAVANMELGLYSSNSLFRNGEFKVEFLGYTVYKDKSCAILNYICDKSSVKIEDTNNGQLREGNSYYSGTVLLDTNSFVPLKGSMIE
ncbi:MAG: hypothetical protein KID00_11110 [Clostridium argentinense]|nr:hypothetical protein [Clostridium argentinense]